MPNPIQIRMGGYGPASTGFSRALKRIGDRLTAEFGERVEIKYVWNIMELGYRAEDILWLGAVPMRMDLTQAIEMIAAGTIDAQENPLSNTVTYGVHKFHRFHTLSNHFYISRPIFLHRTAFEAWPGDLQRAMRSAVTDAT